MSTAVLCIRPEPHYRCNAFTEGLKRLGYDIIHRQNPDPRFRPSGRDDLLVLWNKKRGHDETMAHQWEKLGGTVIVAENGYLQQTDKTYYALATHGHNGSGWFPVGADDRFAKLSFAIKPPRDDGEYILVREQRGIGSQLMASPMGWGQKMVEVLKRHAPFPVRLMAHPGDKGKLEKDLAAMAGARRVVIWSSAIGVRALVEGIPVQHFAPHWICETWAKDREAALQRMAHAQWHFDEIATGEPFARMKAEGWGPRWH